MHFSAGRGVLAVVSLYRRYRFLPAGWLGGVWGVLGWCLLVGFLVSVFRRGCPIYRNRTEIRITISTVDGVLVAFSGIGVDVFDHIGF